MTVCERGNGNVNSLMLWKKGAGNGLGLGIAVSAELALDVGQEGELSSAEDFPGKALFWSHCQVPMKAVSWWLILHSSHALGGSTDM